jgi:PPP family 3-phenylpropionic acid transporter
LSFIHGFAAIFLVSVLAAVFLSPVSPIAENFAMVESAKAGLDYGRQRLWASISFIVGTLVSGFALEVMATGTAVILIAASYVALGLAGFVLPDVKPKMAGGRRVTEARAGDVLRLFRSRVFVVFLLAVSIAQASHAMLYGFGSLHWEQLGISKGMIGVLWGIGVCAEVVFFYFSGRLIPRFAPILLIFIGCLFGVLRWTVTAFDPPLWLLVPLQTLHAATFALTHFGTLHFLMQNVPNSLRNSAQGLYTACSAGLFLMLATAAAGPLFDALAGRAYLAMTAMSLVASALALIVLNVNPRGPKTAAA